MKSEETPGHQNSLMACKHFCKLKKKDLVTSSTWCAQALFLSIGASPCQITRMCFRKFLLEFLQKVFKTLTFRPFGVSTPTSPYWIRLLWKLVTKLSRSPWVTQKVQLCRRNAFGIESILSKSVKITSSSSSTSRVLLIPESA